MKKTIQTLVEMLKEEKTIEAAGVKLAKETPRLSTKAAIGVMEDVNSFIDEKIDDKKLSLFLIQAGFQD